MICRFKLNIYMLFSSEKQVGLKILQSKAQQQHFALAKTVLVVNLQ